MTDAPRPLPLAHYPRPRYPRDSEHEGPQLLLTLLAGGVLGLGTLACGQSRDLSAPPPEAGRLSGEIQPPRPPEPGTPPAPGQPGSKPPARPEGPVPLAGAPQPPRPPKTDPAPKDPPAPDRPRHLAGKIQPARSPSAETK